MKRSKSVNYLQRLSSEEQRALTAKLNSYTQRDGLSVSQPTDTIDDHSTINHSVQTCSTATFASTNSNTNTSISTNNTLDTQSISNDIDSNINQLFHLPRQTPAQSRLLAVPGATPLGKLPNRESLRRSHSADDGGSASASTSISSDNDFRVLSPLQLINAKYRTDATLNKKFLEDFRRIRRKTRRNFQLDNSYKRNLSASLSPKTKKKRFSRFTQQEEAEEEQQQQEYHSQISQRRRNSCDFDVEYESNESQSETVVTQFNQQNKLLQQVRLNKNKKNKKGTKSTGGSGSGRKKDTNDHNDDNDDDDERDLLSDSGEIVCKQEKDSKNETEQKKGKNKNANRNDIGNRISKDPDSNYGSRASLFVSDIKDKILEKFIDQQWNLSRFSEIFLEMNSILVYNNMVLSRLTKDKLGSDKGEKCQLYCIYLFRRLLQMISLLLIVLFVVILGAMYESGEYPTNIQDIPTSVQLTLDRINSLNISNITTNLKYNLNNMNYTQIYSQLADTLSQHAIFPLQMQLIRLQNEWMPNGELGPWEFGYGAKNLIRRYENGEIDSIKPKHPVIIIPGLTSTPLELWQSFETFDKKSKYSTSDTANFNTKTDSNDNYNYNYDYKYNYNNKNNDYNTFQDELFVDCKNYQKRNLREQLWGSTTMLREILLYPKCFLYHLMLNETLSYDGYGGIKIRPTLGLNSVDYLFANAFWVWGIVIENLAAIGYDSNMMHIASYDWRLSFHDLEIRDHYMTRLKQEIELQVKKSPTNEKCVLLMHSLGSNLGFYFLNWVESSKHGNGGKSWVNDHIEAIVPIGGPFLGTPKAVSTILSGEALETAIMAPTVRMLKDIFIPRTWMTRFARTMKSGLWLMPVGGSSIWGNQTWAPDSIDNFNGGDSGGPGGKSGTATETERDVDVCKAGDIGECLIEDKFNPGYLLSFRSKDLLMNNSNLEPISRYLTCSTTPNDVLINKYDEVSSIKSKIWSEIVRNLNKYESKYKTADTVTHNNDSYIVNNNSDTQTETETTPDESWLDVQHLKQIDIDGFIREYTGFDEIMDNDVFGYEINDKGVKSDLSPWWDGSMINTTFGIVFDKIDKIISNLSVGNGNRYELMEHWNEIQLMESYDFDRICCESTSIREEIMIDAIMYSGESNHTLDTWSDILAMIDPKFYHLFQKNVDITYSNPVFFDNSILHGQFDASAASNNNNNSDNSNSNNILSDYNDFYVSNIKENERYFGNVFWNPLWNASNLTMYCFYGTNIDTERSYIYTRDYNASIKYPFRIDTTVNNKDENIINGVHTTDGDHTVPLLTLGYMCHHGWNHDHDDNSMTNGNGNGNGGDNNNDNDNDDELIGNITYKRWNPYKVNIVTYEYFDYGESILQTGTMRGGKKSGDHVDILGNEKFIENVLLIATGNGKKYIKNNIQSNIGKISQNINENLVYQYKQSQEKIKHEQQQQQNEKSLFDQRQKTIWHKWKNDIENYFEKMYNL